jgi:3-hydroxymyristoyl/3-hydroxydecanoyl-(acyl carrier protein) dehydratase
MSADLLIRALDMLPHGAEFRFLDRLIRLDPGKTGEGEYRVRGDEPFLRGHFPGAPIMPGVLLIEAAAQLSGIVAQTDPVAGRILGLKLTAIRAAKIHGSASPGEIVYLESSISGRLGNLIQARAHAVVGGKLVLQTELTLAGGY